MLKTKFLKSTLATLLLGATFASQASLISVTFGGETALDNSGLTSQFIDPTEAPSGQQLAGVRGYFIETFDAATAMAGFGAGTLDYNSSSDSQGCAINSEAAGVEIGGSGSFEVRANSASFAAAPANDQTCFAYTPSEQGGFGTVELNYAPLLANASNLLNATVGINYFGFYWGSIDNYNDFSFFNGDEQIGDTLTGDFLLQTLGGSSGNQSSSETNVYVNIAFAEGASFDKVVINSTGVAGEVDNIVVGFDTAVPVAAPSTLAISGLALLGLAGLRRRK